MRIFILNTQLVKHDCNMRNEIITEEKLLLIHKASELCI